MKRLTRLAREPGFHWLVFCLGAAAFTWPFLAAVDFQSPARVFVHLFGAWVGLIACLAVIARSLGRSEADPDRGDRPGDQGPEGRADV